MQVSFFKVLYGFTGSNLSLATDFCNSLDGRIFEPQSLEQSLEIANKLVDIGLTTFWIGVTDEEEEGR